VLLEVPRRAQRLGRLLTAPARPLPHFLIIGAQKAGTTSLYAYLTQSPDIRAASIKEVHFFDHHYARGERWYRSHFPAAGGTGASWVSGEASPYYLFHPLVPGRVRRDLPDVRLIALLRHPVARAYSHFQHSRARGHEPVADFEEALRLEPERTDAAWRQLERDGSRQAALEKFAYARRSLYAPQLRRWYEAFPEDSLLVLMAEALFADPRRVTLLAREHLGLTTSGPEIDYTPQHTRSYERLSVSTRERLGAVFAPDVAEVESLLGRSTGWTL